MKKFEKISKRGLKYRCCRVTPLAHSASTARRRSFSGAASPVTLGPRAVGLLRVLVERRGLPVSKDTLMETAWTGIAVEESNLPVQIAALRRVLSGAPGGDRWIETLPRRGYRFVGPVDAQEEKVAPSPLPSPDKPSLAVLPFQNLSGDPEQEYFADGMVE